MTRLEAVTLLAAAAIGIVAWRNRHTLHAFIEAARLPAEPDPIGSDPGATVHYLATRWGSR